jgi:hypothetical protein
VVVKEVKHPSGEPHTSIYGDEYYWVLVSSRAKCGPIQTWPSNRMKHGHVARPVRTGHF